MAAAPIVIQALVTLSTSFNQDPNIFDILVGGEIMKVKYTGLQIYPSESKRNKQGLKNN